MTIQEMNRVKKEFGLSNQEIARRSGLPVSTVQRILSGDTASPRMKTLQALEAALYSGTFRTDEKAASPSLREAPLPYSPIPAGKYTVADYYALPEERRVELIDGYFYDMAAPTLTHQKILGQLFLQFHACADAHGENCDVYAAPCDVQLDMDEKTMLQPDLFVICRDYDSRAQALAGAPDLIVEVLSPSTRSKDMLLKLNKYYAAGVREYWIVDPEQEQVIVHDFTVPNRHLDTYSFDDRIPIRISQGTCFIDFARIHRKL